MAKLIALVLAATALVAHAQDNACPPNAQICGSEIIDKYKCGFLSRQKNEKLHPIF